MKHPTPSDFLVEVKEAYVSVIFKPNDSHYSFGRLADPGGIAWGTPRTHRPPAPEVFVPAFAAWPAALCQPAPRPR